MEMKQLWKLCADGRKAARRIQIERRRCAARPKRKMVHRNGN
jgi:hypothetical protein